MFEISRARKRKQSATSALETRVLLRDKKARNDDTLQGMLDV